LEPPPPRATPLSETFDPETSSRYQISVYSGY
jgi:hypothetical protein